MLTGPALDFERQENVAQLLADRRLQVRASRVRLGESHFSLLRFQDGRLPAAVYVPDGQIAPPSREVGGGYLQILRDASDSWRPDVVITYGGYWLGPHVLNLAKSRRAKTVFWLCNFAYREPAAFEGVDMTIVPSNCSREHYRDVVGIESVVAAPLIDWHTIVCSPLATERYVTFVNPEPNKGVFVFARIAEQLHRTRPDIPLLVVEGRGGHRWLQRTSVDLSPCGNIHGMDNTPDPRDFYRVSRIVLMPSLWRESVGMVAAEAMINGIPVLASDRGALPDVLGDAGPPLNIPAKYTPESRQAPRADAGHAPRPGGRRSSAEPTPGY